ncbi:alpha/beta hydrolase [Pseudoalteromonas sp. GB56]
MNRLSITLMLFFSAFVHAGNTYSELPEVVDPTASYIFYSHGYIVEGDDSRPEHPRWGVYDFPAVVSAIAELGAPKRNFTIIAEHRAKNTDSFAHAKKLESQVRQLISRGVLAKNITLIGFSRGGYITAITSSYLANKDIKVVILAACTSGLAKQPHIQLYGHVLSIYETSDSVGSCDEVVARNPDNIASYQEVAITTGKEHGAFYQPSEQWLMPLKIWLSRGN